MGDGFFADGDRFFAGAVFQLGGNALDFFGVLGLPCGAGQMVGADGAAGGAVFLEGPVSVGAGAREEGACCFG